MQLTFRELNVHVMITRRPKTRSVDLVARMNVATILCAELISNVENYPKICLESTKAAAQFN